MPFNFKPSPIIIVWLFTFQVQDNLPGNDSQPLITTTHTNNCETNNQQPQPLQDQQHVTGTSNNVTSPDKVSTNLSTNNCGVVQSSSVVVNNSTTTNVSNSHQQISASDILWWREGLNLDKANLALVGFSKGCVVLNQVNFYS